MRSNSAAEILALKSMRILTLGGNSTTPLVLIVSNAGGGSLPGQWLRGMVRPSKSETPRRRASASSLARRSEARGGKGGQRAEERADRRAGAAENDDFFHGISCVFTTRVFYHGSC